MEGRSRQGKGWIAAALLVAIAVPAATGAPDGATAGAPVLKLRTVGQFTEPLYVDNAPGKRRLLFVVERPGTIRVLRNGKELRRPFLDIRDRVLTNHTEAGLLSIAFDPDYKRNRAFYVYYVNNDGDLSVDRFKRRARKATVAKKRSRQAVIEIAHPTFSGHNGGQLQFGPDGLLYVATGDGGNPGDPDENAQDRTSLLGKLLRIDPRARGGYKVPTRNPYADHPGQDEIYALGLRNPWRFAFDRRTRSITIGDVGQGSWEEIDHLGIAEARRANFGWDNLEGTHPHEAPFTEPPGYVPPVHEYPSDLGACAVTGGYVVRDPKLPLAGRYLYADYCLGELRTLLPAAANPAATDAPTGLRVDAPSSFGEGARQRIYVTSLLGPVYKLVAG